MRTTFIIVGFLALLVPFGEARAQDPLDAYIHEGLANNVVLNQRTIALEKAMISLRMANGLFAPAVSLQANYTSGLGGRNIAIPIGDLLNPVYQTLNQLTSSDQFPQISNVNQNFFPYNFYDTRVHTTLPIVNTDLIYNRRISRQQVVLQEFEADIYRRELIRNIKVAYYNYLSAKEAVRIYASAMKRAEEGQRVNESLMNNGKAVPAYVLRSQSEVEQVRTQLEDAGRQVTNAGLYFNFLLNRDSSQPIVDQFDVQQALGTLKINTSDTLSTSRREELSMLRESVELNKNVKRMNDLYWVPRVSGFLDLGSQAQNWEFNKQSRYYLFGVQLEIPLFAGSRNRNQSRLSELNLRSAQLQVSGSTQQIALAARTAQNNLLTAWQQFQAYQKQQEAATSYQRLLEKGYKEGVNTFIEVLDARTQMTQAQLQVSLSRYQVLAAAAQVERETASYELPTNEK